MSGTTALSEGPLSLTGNNLTYVIIAAVIALVALGFAAGLVRAVLATGRGTQKMQDIAGAVQEGASAYLFRQFKTLGVFVVIAVVLLFLLPVNEGGLSVKIGRSVFFIVGAVFSAFIGGAGMALATRANLWRTAQRGKAAHGTELCRQGRPDHWGRKEYRPAHRTRSCGARGFHRRQRPERPRRRR